MKKVNLFLQIILVYFAFNIHSQSISSLADLNSLDLMKYKNQMLNSALPIKSSGLSLETSAKEKDVYENIANLNIDQIIDANEFYIGPGDILLVNIWGADQNSFYLTVNSEGVIIIPSFGVVDIGKKTLASIKEDIINVLRSKYKNVEISVSISQLSQFSVNVEGYVEKPGQYTVNGISRISDVVRLTGGINDHGKRRNIVIMNSNYPTVYADLSKASNSGIYDENPFVKKGDRIIVGRREETVEIWGCVSFPGVYDYCDSETIMDIVELSGGMLFNADTNRIEVTRFKNDKDSLKYYSIPYSDVNTFEIIPHDRISINAIYNYKVHRKVTIKGEVKFPGTYTIDDDKTKLLDVIKRAGGFTEDAFLPASTISRKDFTPIGKKEFVRLQNMPVIELDPSERSYLKYSMIEDPGLISINFSKLDEEQMYDIILRNGDDINIARNNLTVKVMGAVLKPGLINFDSKNDYKDYIALAGGFKKIARKSKIMIIKGGTETWIEPDKVDRIEVGDAIWVPEKRYIDGLTSLKDVLLILGSIATILISTITIHDALTD